MSDHREVTRRSSRRDPLAVAYAEQLGGAALERQQAEGAERHPCCGERIADGHHQMCSKRPVDEPPAEIDGQELLL